jgi:hypothetical protein
MWVHIVEMKFVYPFSRTYCSPPVLFLISQLWKRLKSLQVKWIVAASKELQAGWIQLGKKRKCSRVIADKVRSRLDCTRRDSISPPCTPGTSSDKSLRARAAVLAGYRSSINCVDVSDLSLSSPASLSTRGLPLTFGLEDERIRPCNGKRTLSVKRVKLFLKE